MIRRNDRANESQEERKMYPATCVECGEKCEVPFEPEAGKPVRCSDCFRKSRPQRSTTGGRFNNNRNNSSDRFERQMHKAKCAECGKECEVPFKPNGKKPVLCRECFQNKRE